MKKVVLYEPSIGSDNLGDQIIVDAIKDALKGYLKDAFVIELPTHTPLNWRYLRYLEKTPADMKIVCGSNIIVNKINSIIHLRQWNIPMSSIPLMGKFVFIGVGTQQYNQKIYPYTKWAYKKMMRGDFVHSVRDQYTESSMKMAGITNVVNTACPTMWGLTEKHCKEIPEKKAPNCVMTLTDYKADENRDNQILKILKKNYNKVYFWPQGNGDYKYFLKLKENRNVEIIPPSLKEYDTYLENNDIDFIGTRLHGGMRALQKRKRTLIIGVDNRAIELKHDFGIPVIEQKDMTRLEDKICTDFSTKISLPEENINKFLNQFGVDK